MATFEKAFKKVIANEGGYVNNPNDKGGETYMGICRKNYPNSEMWRLIDNIKKEVGNIPKQINIKAKEDEKINNIVKEIYKHNYWNKLKLDEIKSESIALMAFDDAVNRGCVAAIKSIQRILHLPQTGRMSKEIIDKLK